MRTMRRASVLPWVYRAGRRLMLGDDRVLAGRPLDEQIAIVQAAVELLVERDRARHPRGRAA